MPLPTLPPLSSGVARLVRSSKFIYVAIACAFVWTGLLLGRITYDQASGCTVAIVGVAVLATSLEDRGKGDTPPPPEPPAGGAP